MYRGIDVSFSVSSDVQSALYGEVVVNPVASHVGTIRNRSRFAKWADVKIRVLCAVVQ